MKVKNRGKLFHKFFTRRGKNIFLAEYSPKLCEKYIQPYRLTSALVLSPIFSLHGLGLVFALN